MASVRGAKLGIFVISAEIIFLILFGVFVRYDDLGMPTFTESKTHSAGDENSTSPSVLDSKPAVAADDGHGNSEETVAAHMSGFYSMFQDIHVMMFIGFGFLMTFLKRYGFSSVGLNFLVAAFVLQWATLTGGWIRHYDYENNSIHVNMATLIDADFASAAILISFGAVLGKVSALQLLIMAVVEVVVFQVNELIVFNLFLATDIGDSMVVHTFGAYFGLAVARIIYKEDVEDAEEKEGSIYHSDLFSMIGTIFLWLFWPSFNGGLAVDEGQLRAVINTYYSLTASAVITFAISALVTKDKFNMVHIQNSTLAGGVAIGTLADLIIQPWAAILVGGLAGAISVLGFRFLTPLLAKKLKFHDTCGVHNLHGMPGILSAIGAILAAGLATPELYGDGRIKIFVDGSRTTGQLAGFQAAALAVSFVLAVVGGVITGFILRIPFLDQPRGEHIFDDDENWLLPPTSLVEITAAPQPPIDGATISIQLQPREKVAINGANGSPADSNDGNVRI